MHAWQRRLLAATAQPRRDAPRPDGSLFDLTIAARSIVDENYAWMCGKTPAR